MRPRPRLRWLYRPDALPAVEYGEFSFAAWPFPSDPLVLQWQDDAWQRMWHALDTAFGGLPPDLEAEPLVMRGDPGPVLVGAARRDGDRLVVGAGRRGPRGARERHARVRT